MQLTDDAALDLYACDGSAWGQAQTFAGGGLENRLPSAVYDSNGVGHVVWLRGEDLVHATLDAPETIRAGSASMAFYSAQLFNNPQGNLTLVWQETADNGPANIFAMLCDLLSQTWSVDRRLTEENNRATNYVSNRPPEAIAVADSTAGAPPLTVNFDASASGDPEGDSISYRWTFGDGSYKRRVRATLTLSGCTRWRPRT